MIGLKKSGLPFIVNKQDSLMKATIEYIYLFPVFFFSIATEIAIQSKIVYVPVSIINVLSRLPH